ncbi:hypothetical protein [Niabella aurantiaca]|uniref:hypothetical protein n=1 Tax=Niabella aurantiaca TaxID=379900 RepID=UPI000592D6D6|nr:hypothetical protein [Niabella aurantiaca]
MHPCKIETSLKDQALTELRTVLKNNTVWVKVHAAEYLLWLHEDNSEVQKAYLDEYGKYQNEPKYRIGISRVLYQTESDPAKKKAWVDKVLAVFGDTTSPDRIHAAETLAKLKTSPQPLYPEATHAALGDTSRILQTYTLWATSYTSAETEEKNKQEFIRRSFEDPDPIIRKISAYVLLKSKDLTPREWSSFATKALNEPAGSELRNNLLHAAFVTYLGDDETTFQKIKTEMTRDWKQFTASQRIELAQALAEQGDCDDATVLSAFLNNNENNGLYEAQSATGADVRAAAAYAILKIAERTSK